MVDALLILLEELSRPYKAIGGHPSHILHSELYLIHLLADCCSANWQHLNLSNKRANAEDQHDSSSPDSLADHLRKSTPLPDERDVGFRDTWEPRDTHQYGSTLPKPLDDALVGRILDAIKQFIQPISEPYILAASTILDDGTSLSSQIGTSTFSDSANLGSSSVGVRSSSKLLDEKSEEIELCTRAIVEFISASNWFYVLEHLKSTLRGVRTTHSSQNTINQNIVAGDDDTTALITLRLVGCFRVDTRKLGTIIQEFCGSFLHLRKPFQYTVAIVVPLLVTRWLDQNPAEFVNLHIEHKRLDGMADTLFDMTNTMVDGGKWKSVLYPFQNALLLLLPDVFQVASNMRDAKSSSMIKKVAFLEGLRKALRNRNSTAAYCLISLLRAARHFRLDSDSALLSYALDVQDEVREAVFRRYMPGVDSTSFDDSLMTAAFVTLAHLNFDMCHQNLAPLCLAANAPQDFKVAYISACCYFARQQNCDVYQPLFAKASGLVRSHLKVR